MVDISDLDSLRDKILLNVYQKMAIEDSLVGDTGSLIPEGRGALSGCPWNKEEVMGHLMVNCYVTRATPIGNVTEAESEILNRFSVKDFPDRDRDCDHDRCSGIPEKTSSGDLGGSNFEKFSKETSSYGDLGSEGVGSPLSSRGSSSLDETSVLVSEGRSGHVGMFFERVVCKLVVKSWVWDLWCETGEGRSWILKSSSLAMIPYLLIY